MQITQVTPDDAKRCANLMAFLVKVQGLSGVDAEEFMRVRKWVHDLALGMAQDLRKVAEPTTGFKVKSITPNVVSTPRKSKKNSKK